MRKALFCFFLSLSFLYVGSVASATAEYKDENVTIQIYDTPCTSEAVKKLGYDKKLIDLARAGKVSYKGKILEMCWIYNDGEIDIVDETGDTGSIPAIAFKLKDAI